MKNRNSWKNIKWKNIKKEVFHLQLQIFKAAANKNFEKMYKLQKKLISSESSKYLSIKQITEDDLIKKRSKIEKLLTLTPSEKFTLANQLILDEKSFSLDKISSVINYEQRRSFGLLLIKDQAKQMLAYLALCPQWEAQFESNSYGFRPGKSIHDIIKTTFIGIRKIPKWVLKANVVKSSFKLNYAYIVEKCNTYPSMQRQIWAWLQTGMMDKKYFVYSKIQIPYNRMLSSLLLNITLNGLAEILNTHINKVIEYKPNNCYKVIYLRYANDFIIIDSSKKVLENLKETIQEFLKFIGLNLHPIKTQILYTLETKSNLAHIFSFLGFDILQKRRKSQQNNFQLFKTIKLNRKIVTLITPSKNEIQKHKTQIKKLIHRLKGANQIKLIQSLQFIINKWSLAKRLQIPNKMVQDLDKFLFLHLWKWAKKRHPKMPRVNLKNKYWHQIANRKRIFGVKQNEQIIVKLISYSKIFNKRYMKIRKFVSPFKKNFTY